MVNIKTQIKYLFCIFSLLVCVGCKRATHSEFAKYKVITPNKSLRAIEFQLSKKIKEEKNLHLRHISQKSWLHEIIASDIHIECRRPLSIEEARELLLYVAIEYQKDIYSEPILQSILSKNPFPIEAMDIKIWIRNLDSSQPQMNELSYVKTQEGVLSYESGSNYLKYKIHHIETFDQAIKKIDLKKIQSPDFNITNLPNPFPVRSDKEYYNIAAALSDLNFKSLAKVNKEKDVVLKGIFLMRSKPINQITLNIGSYRSLSIEEARDLLVSFAKNFQKNINSNKKLKPFLIEHPFPIERIQVKIDINTEDGQYFSQDQLTYINLENGKVQYRDDSARDVYTVKYLPSGKIEKIRNPLGGKQEILSNDVDYYAQTLLLEESFKQAVKLARSR